ncbi:MAG: AtpZ/AtpI family protein [Lautropia sp.]
MSDELRRSVSRQARRMKRARSRGAPPVLGSLGVMGLVGWSVAVPTLLGVAIGGWIDHAADSAVSWTLTLLVAGVVLGCANAWYWLHAEAGTPDDDGGAGA